MTDAGGGPRRTRRLLQLIVVLVLWGLMTHGTFAGSGDEPHYLVIAHSIAFDWDLDLSNNYGANVPLVAGGALQPEAHVQPGVDGVGRPVHDVGLPLLFVPVVRVAEPLTYVLTNTIPARILERARLTPGLLYRHLLSLAMIALTVILAGRIFDAGILLGASTRAAFGGTLLIVLSPPLLIFSILFFTELLSAWLCFVVFCRLALAPAKGAASWAWIGAATGLLFLVHARNIGLVLPLTAIAVPQLRASSDRRDAMAFGAGLIALIAIRTAFNHHFWGTWITSPHARLSGAFDLGALLHEIGIRLAGLLVDQEFGLLVYAPVYLLAIAGFVALSRSRREIDADLTIRALLVCGVYVLFIVLPFTNVHGWTGGWSPAARFLTPIVPLFGIALIAGLRAAPLALVAIIVAAQIGIDVFVWSRPKLLWNDGNGRAAFCEPLGERVCDYLPALAKRPLP
jgi:hypothetical protein